MRNIILILSAILILASNAFTSAMPTKTVIGWTFNGKTGLQGWQPNTHLSKVKLDAEGLSALASDWDPFIESPKFDVTVNPNQWIELRIKCNKPGSGQIYWSNTMVSPYGGYLPDKMTPFVFPGGNVWKTIVIHPFWHAEKKIIHIRIDLFQEADFTLKSIKIVEPANQSKPVTGSKWDFTKGSGRWDPQSDFKINETSSGLAFRTDAKDNMIWSPVLSIPIADKTWAAVRMKASKSGKAFLNWVTDSTSGLQASGFAVNGDGKFHTYNIDLGSNLAWTGKLVLMSLTPSDVSGNNAVVSSISLEREMTGAPDLVQDYIGMEDAVNRIGKPCKIMARFNNQGGTDTTGIKAEITVPKGVTAKLIESPGKFEPNTPAAFRYELISKAPVDGEFTIRLKGRGASDTVYKSKLVITKAPTFIPNGYIPEVIPAKTAYNIGLYYFPGWDTAGKWEPISRVAPIRKPVLGYYDEANPECADWQIKWAAEHGISFFLVDWYWNQGNKTLDHWIHKAYMKSRYKGNLKWAVMWANHNPPGSHSMQDWKNVTQYWIDNYFGMKEYLRIDGKPAIFMWSPAGLRNDVGGAKESAKLLAMSQQMAKDAGYPGITFASMNEGGSPTTASMMASEGYTFNTEYHWFADAMSLAKDPNSFPYSLVVDRSKQAWESRAKVMNAAGIKFLPVPDTGWDARPWHGDKSFIITGRNVPQWERLLREAKSYLDARGEKTVILGPCNEWGEGSYIEPNTEFGFGMYDAVRRVFCDDTPHQDIAPVDVGLGPYDLPVPKLENKTIWQFNKPGDTEGWFSMMNLSNAEAIDGNLFANVTGSDPAFSGPNMRVMASKYKSVSIRMKTSSAIGIKDVVQLFWSTSTAGVSEASMIGLPLIPDGEYHTYVFPVGDSPRWRGTITGFRLDPCSNLGMKIWIDEIKLQ
ncbi:glycoside hydrolase family 99-like domain-containing protein [uncultured Desulfobulbus sp.]|uniref:glycoside hydrolase family 99-like domain-containing protein n=1 Tax=uncultured Desulfobulbus sp. TaxID=239745 RepID=UPI0029C697BA|nr:glycoside hydrolase family 99-like domain-containing protein [uncultured Desulfobulbus sp.]